MTKKIIRVLVVAWLVAVLVAAGLLVHTFTSPAPRPPAPCARCILL